MAYISADVGDRALVRSRYRCEACGSHWSEFEKRSGDSPIDIHSATSLHLVWNDKRAMYKATSVPEGLIRLKNRFFKPGGFLVYTHMSKRPDDAFCLCNRCHLKVHAMAREWSKSFLGEAKDRKNDVPSILEYVTVMYVMSGGKWAP